jgi:hypothetical protein
VPPVNVSIHRKRTRDKDGILPRIEVSRGAAESAEEEKAEEKRFHAEPQRTQMKKTQGVKRSHAEPRNGQRKKTQ